jgi:hypothetical protein
VNETEESPWVQYNIPAQTSNDHYRHHQHNLEDHEQQQQATTQYVSYTQEYILQRLMCSAQYVATMRARNAYGESDNSEQFRFRTAAGSSVRAALLNALLHCGQCTTLLLLRGPNCCQSVQSAEVTPV